MLHQSGLFGSPTKKAQTSQNPESIEEAEGDVEMSLVYDIDYLWSSIS